MKLRMFLIAASLGFFCHARPAMPQTAPAPTLSLADAEARTLKNQPRLLAEQFRVQAANKRISEPRASYFPQAFGNLTAIEANGDTASLEFDSDKSAAARLLSQLIAAGLPVSSFVSEGTGLEGAYLRTGIRQVD